MADTPESTVSASYTPTAIIARVGMAAINMNYK